MANYAVGRLHIAKLWNPVVALSTIGMPHPGMKVSRCVALFTGIGVMGKAQNCCSGSSKNTYALRVAAETVGIHIRVMKVCQVTLIRTTEGVAGCTARYYHITGLRSTVVTCSTISMT